MNNKATFDPSQPLTIYFRCARNGTLDFVFVDEDGNAYSFIYEDVELNIYEYEGSKKKIISLYAGNGMTHPASGTARFTVTATLTNINEGQYYFELYRPDLGITWVSGYAYFHNGKFDGIQQSSTTIDVTSGQDRVTIIIQGGGISTTLTSLGLILQTAADDIPLDPDTFHFWDFVAGILKKVSFTNLKATLKTYFDTIYVSLADYHFKGLYTTVLALETAHPTADPGDYATVDAGSGTDAVNYIWDEDEGWIQGSGSSVASAVSFIPSGGIAATNVQTALEELDTEKSDIDDIISSTQFLVNTETDNYTLAIGDISPTTGKPVLNIMNAATAKSFTLPKEIDVPTPTGTTVYFKRIGAGRLSIAGDSGVTVNSPVGIYTDPGLNVIFSCTYLGSDIWDLQNGVSVSLPVVSAYRISGQYYDAAVNGTGKTTQLQSANTIRARAFVVSVSTTFNSIKSDVTTAVALSKYRIGIYTDNGFGYPDALVANTDTGEYDSASPGVKTGTTASNVTLAPGLYHIAYNCSHAITLRADNVAAVNNVYGVNPTTITAVYSEQAKTSVTYGPMPSTFPAGAAFGSNNPVVVAINFI